MITSEAIEGKRFSEDSSGRPFSRILVAVAGPAMNIVFAFLIASVIWFIGLPCSSIRRLSAVWIPSLPKAAPASGGRPHHSHLGPPPKSWQDINLEVFTALTNVVPVTFQHPGGIHSIPPHQTFGDARPEMAGFGTAGEASGRDGEARHARRPRRAPPRDKFISFDGVYVLNQEHLTELIRKGEGRPARWSSNAAEKKANRNHHPGLRTDRKRG